MYTGDDHNGSTLAIWVNIGLFNMTFIQYRSTTKDDKTPAVKRILRISVDKIPMIEKVPLVRNIFFSRSDLGFSRAQHKSELSEANCGAQVNKLPQPFDHLVYIWIDDPDTPTGITKGITRQMIDTDLGGPSAINSTLRDISIPPIQWKETKNKPDPSDVVLQAGHHFIVVTNNKVVLDHVFQPDQKVPDSSLAPHNRTAEVSRTDEHGEMTPKPTASVARKAAGPTSATLSEAPATKGDSNTQAGALTVSALTFQYKNGSLFVGVDATLLLGPLAFSVIGFTIEIAMGDPNFRLNNLTNVPIHVSIHGLDAKVDKEPLTIAGAFVHDTTVGTAAGTSIESYRGGVAVGFKAWKVLAVGEYAVVTTLSDGSQYKSIFV